MGHKASYNLVAELLHQLDYSLQANKKPLKALRILTGALSLNILIKRQLIFNRDFNRLSRSIQRKKNVSENSRTVGVNGGRKETPERVQIHDFGKKRVAPYCVYDLVQNAGWESVSIDHDTPTFAVESVRQW